MSLYVSLFNTDQFCLSSASFSHQLFCVIKLKCLKRHHYFWCSCSNKKWSSQGVRGKCYTVSSTAKLLFVKTWLSTVRLIKLCDTQQSTGWISSVTENCCFCRFQQDVQREQSFIYSSLQSLKGAQTKPNRKDGSCTWNTLAYSQKLTLDTKLIWLGCWGQRQARMCFEKYLCASDKKRNIFRKKYTQMEKEQPLFVVFTFL